MTAKDIAKDNQSENGINEHPQEMKIIPKAVCNNLPPITVLKIDKESGGVKKIVYGRDYDTICQVCKRSFRDHETINYRKDFGKKA